MTHIAPFQRPDLHCHSLASDGVLAPADLVARAAEYGVDALALTDHDTLAGLPEARAAAAGHGITLIDGIELSVLWGTREIHVLGLWVNPECPVLGARVAAQLDARRERARRIGARLDKAARIEDSYAKACEKAASDTPGRPWFARVLVEEGVVRDQRHAFNRFLKKGQSAFVSTPWVTLEQGVRDLLAAGGVPVLAHPQAYSLTRKRLRELVRDFRNAGGLAMEAVMPGLSAQQAGLLEECWRHFGLAVSGGSDFHSPQQKWLSLGGLPPFPPDGRAVWQLPEAGYAAADAGSPDPDLEVSVS
ncbi:MAG: PHP domain-containing protein [Alcanivorax sp.]|nr:PHP domain-containing protein [Alcanivorax sp.]